MTHATDHRQPPHLILFPLEWSNIVCWPVLPERDTVLCSAALLCCVPSNTAPVPCETGDSRGYHFLVAIFGLYLLIYHFVARHVGLPSPPPGGKPSPSGPASHQNASLDKMVLVSVALQFGIDPVIPAIVNMPPSVATHYPVFSLFSSFTASVDKFGERRNEINENTNATYIFYPTLISARHRPQMVP